MQTNNVLNKIFRNPIQELIIFDDPNSLSFFEKEKGKYYVKSISNNEPERLVYNENTGKSAPEEIVRQLYLTLLTKRYRYPKHLIDIEKTVNFGREQKRADIVVYRDDGITPKIIVETKAPSEENDIQQLKSYLNAEGAPVGVGINGKSSLFLYRPYPKEFDDTLDDIPAVDEEVDDVLAKKKTLTDLEEKDLKTVIVNLEELVLANSGVDSFDEIFKLIYTKLYDEKEALNRPDQIVFFRKSPTKLPSATYKTIETLFAKAKEEWPDVFEQTERIKLTPEHLSVCVGELQNLKLFGSNLRIIDEAFEYLLPAVAKGKKGQYFTPRIVIDMCVKMLDPKGNEYVIDTACGSAGFLVHTMQHVWGSLPNFQAKKDYAARRLFGIDFDEKSAKISRAIMLIAGDGKSHIYKSNSLSTSDWSPSFKEQLHTYNLVTQFATHEDNALNRENLRYLNFDVLLANPPFAGEVKEKRLLAQYTLAHKSNGKLQNSVSRHILFIEKNLDLVKEGGRLAIVLPQGIFNNSGDEIVRKYIMKHSRILAVVGLDGNSFKPHTGTKTSVIFLQKWRTNELDEMYDPLLKDYPIFFATSEVPFKNNSGNYIFKTDGEGVTVKAADGNPVYQSDLDEIAEAFRRWGGEQGFNFVA